MPKQKKHLPNLSQYDIQSRAGDYAKHNRCGGLIAKQPFPKLETPTVKKGLHCVKCRRNVGKMGRALIREHTTSMVEHVSGIGTMRIYFYPPAPSEENEGLGEPGIRKNQLAAAMIETMNDGMFRQQYGDITEVPGPRSKKVLPSAEPPKAPRHMSKATYAKTVTGRMVSTGPLLPAPAEMYEGGIPTGIPAGLSVAKTRARAVAKRLRNIEGRKKKKPSPQWDRTSIAAAMVRETARREAIEAVKGCTTGRTETSRERKIRLEHAEEVKKEISAWNRGDKARVEYIERAREVIEEYQLKRGATPAWAVRAVKQHRKDMEQSLYDAVTLIETPDKSARWNAHLVRLNKKTLSQLTSAVEYLEYKKRFYEEN